MARESEKTEKEVAEMIAAFAQMRQQMQLLLQGGIPGARAVCLEASVFASALAHRHHRGSQTAQVAHACRLPEVAC